MTGHIPIVIDSKMAGRFWSKVDIRGPDDCWPWLAAKLRKTATRAYGRIGYKSHVLYAHRLAWVLTHGLIPEGICVCHRCDFGLCCNPKHLFLGTIADNTADMVEKGRAASLGGEKNPRSKLTAEQVLEIRHRYAAGKVTQRKLATEYHVSQENISAITRRRTWFHI